MQIAYSAGLCVVYIMIQNKKSFTISNATVERMDEDAVEICWETGFNDLKVSIYVGDSPFTIDLTSPVVRLTGETCVVISGLDPDARHYFRVVPEAGSGIIIGERLVPLEGTVNFRDLGGYKASDGRRVKWGRVFRSDSLAMLTDSDQSILRRMEIKLVCDFRSPAEAKHSPDRLPQENSIEYLHLPITHGEFEFVTALERIKKGDISWLTEDFMVKGYIHNIDEFPSIWGTVRHRLAALDSRPMVFHCAGGKDRTGTCAALILLALDIPEETVIYDHQLSNVFIAKPLKKFFKEVESYGIDPEKIVSYFTAPRECVVSLLLHIRKTYGSAAKYLSTQCGVSGETLDLLKQKLLE